MARPGSICFNFCDSAKIKSLENCGNWICPLIIDQDISMNDTIWLWSLLNSLIVWRHWYVNGTHMAQFRNWGNTHLTLKKLPGITLFIFFQFFFVSLKQTSGWLRCGWSIGELFGVFTFDNFWRLNHKAENRFCPTCRIPTKFSRNSYFLQTVIGRPALSKNCCIIFPFFTFRKFSTGLRNEVWCFVAFLCYFFPKVEGGSWPLPCKVFFYNFNDGWHSFIVSQILDKINQENNCWPSFSFVFVKICRKRIMQNIQLLCTNQKKASGSFAFAFAYTIGYKLL